MRSYSLKKRRSISTVAVVVVIVIILVVAGTGVYILSTQGKATTTSVVTTATTTTTVLTGASSSSTAAQITTSSLPTNITVVFGASLSMTGPAQAFGVEDNWTLVNAVDYINSHGGITLQNGSTAKVKLVVLNDQSSDTISLSNYQTLVSTYHANVLMGQLGTIDDLVASNFATQNQVPIIGPFYLSAAKSCTTADCSNAWTFGTFHNETNEAHVFFNWFKTVDPPSSSHPVTVAFFEETDDSAQANAKAGEAYAQQMGYTVCTCSDTSFTAGDSAGMQAFLSAAQSAHADAVFGLPTPSDGVLMINTAKQIGYQPKAWLLTRGTAAAPFALSQLGGLGNLSSGVLSAFPWEAGLPYTASLLGNNISNSQIVQEYEQSQGHPPFLEGVYYSGVVVAADAISQASNLSNVAIRQAVRTHTYQTFMGPMSFTPGGQWVQSDQYMLLQQWQIVPFGNSTIPSLQILEPTNVATTHYIIYPFTFQNQVQAPWPPSSSTTTTTS
jgi:ABC-type branched-subunit amino acid transport system substrate-binding protein